MQILVDRIIWDREDFLAGYVPDPSAAFSWSETGAAVMINIETFGASGVGTILPGGNPTSVGTVNTAVLVSADFDHSASFAYLLGADLHQFDVSSDTLTKNATWPHTMTHGSTTGGGTLGQIVLYRTATAKAMFYSFATGTLTDVGVYDIDNNGFDDDFMSTIPSSPGTMTAGFMAPLLATSDDRLLMGTYVANQGKIHSYKASNNTRETNVLNLPFFMEPVGMVEEENGFDTVIFATSARGTNRRGRAKAFWWSIDRPASWYKASPIPDDECSAPFVFMGTVGCFTRSRTSSVSSSTKTSVLRIFEDGRWIPKFHWGGSLPAINGVEIQDNTVVWNSDGKIYRWGPRWNKYPIATFQETAGSGSTSGLLKSLSNATTAYKLYISSGTGTSGIENFGQFNTASWQGGSAAPKFPFGKKGKVTGVQVHLAGGSAGGGRSIKLGLINEAFTNTNIFSDLSSFTSTDAIKKYLPESFTARIVEFSAIAPAIEWATGSGASNAAGIERVEVFFETVDIRGT